MSAAYLEAILAAVDKAGVYHMPKLDKSLILAAAGANGFATFRVDLAAARDKGAMLAAIGKTLAFPEWFGQNLDALADCLGDMGWRPAEGYLIILEHCDVIHGSATEDFSAMLEVFEQAADEWREQGVAFWCLVEMLADGIAWLPDGP